MTVAAECPQREQLQQLLLGRASDVAAERLEGHVADCDRCARLLPTLRADDALVEAMRARARLVLEPSDLKVIQRLLPRLHQLRTALPSQHTLGSGEIRPPRADLESFPFLRPAEAAGEIGRLGTYRVLQLLGHGGMGVVFRAEDRHLQRIVALKVMWPELARSASARERFLREARAAARIEHEHIVTIYQVGEDRGILYLAMQLLRGMSLEEFLARKEARRPGPVLRVSQILKLGREIACGLAAAHAQGLVHRDIKPANIWLDDTAGGRVKILDFGLARVAAVDTPLTQLGTIVGTPAYMAPEQAQGDPIDGRADLFSLGCVLYRLCTGRLPWQGSDPQATLDAIADQEPIPVQEANPNLPPKLARLVMRLLARRPANRPRSARWVAAALRTIERERPVKNRRRPSATPRAASPPPAEHEEMDAAGILFSEPPARPPARLYLLLGLTLLAGLAIVLLAIAIGYALSSGGPRHNKIKDTGSPRLRAVQEFGRSLRNGSRVEAGVGPEGPHYPREEFA